jgi:putative ABC transport system ATP-binding protein
MLELIDVCHQYDTGKPVLNDICATFEKGKVTAIMGQSGAGKSTLLSLIAGLSTCKAGDILYNGKNLRSLDLDNYRGSHIGLVFQSYNLLENSTALYNITLAMNISRVGAGSNKKDFAMKLLNSMDIDRETATRKVTQLSGGQRQRVGIARALAKNPDLIIADEPTGNLDEKTEADILAILTRLAHKEGKCVIIVTHSDNVSAIADKVYHIDEGSIIRTCGQ